MPQELPNVVVVLGAVCSGVGVVGDIFRESKDVTIDDGFPSGVAWSNTTDAVLSAIGRGRDDSRAAVHAVIGEHLLPYVSAIAEEFPESRFLVIERRPVVEVIDDQLAFFGMQNPFVEAKSRSVRRHPRSHLFPTLPGRSDLYAACFDYTTGYHEATRRLLEEFTDTSRLMVALSGTLIHGRGQNSLRRFARLSEARETSIGSDFAAS